MSEQNPEPKSSDPTLEEEDKAQKNAEQSTVESDPSNVTSHTVFDTVLDQPPEGLTPTGWPT